MKIASVKTCYVSMAFGVKTDAQSGRTVDHDRIYWELIRPAVERAGLVCQRADDFTGALIHKDIAKAVITADVMVADVSGGNGNVMYELGIRHALRRGATVLITSGRLPFNLSYTYALQYPLGADGGVDAGALDERRAMLAGAIAAKAERPATDSPLFEYFPGLQVLLPEDLSPPEARGRAPAFEPQNLKPGGHDSKGLVARAEQAVRRSAEVEPQAWLDILRRYRDLGEWKEVVRFCDEMPSDLSRQPEAVQAVALALSRLGDTGHAIALLSRQGGVGDNPELLGLLGSLYKKRHFADGSVADLDAAIDYYRRAFERNDQDLYLGRNLAQLLHRRGSTETRAELSRRLPELRNLAQVRLAVPVRDFWLLDSALVLELLGGDGSAARQITDEMVAMRPEAWMLDAARTELQGVLERAVDDAERARVRELIERLAPGSVDEAEEADDAQL